jgi:hypothetical protein
MAGNYPNEDLWTVTKLITDMPQSFINRCLCRFIDIRWPETISNEDLWTVTKLITDMSQSFINRCLCRFIDIRWPETIPNEDLWTVTNQQPIDVHIKKIKLNWIGHTLTKPTGAIEKTAPDWKAQGPRKTCRKTGEG